MLNLHAHGSVFWLHAHQLRILGRKIEKQKEKLPAYSGAISW